MGVRVSLQFRESHQIRNEAMVAIFVEDARMPSRYSA